MKTRFRFNRASGSTRRRIERLVTEIRADAEARRRSMSRALPMPQTTWERVEA